MSTATFSRELDGTERHRLLEEWNATRSAYPQGHCIHELFEEQVQRRPQAVALVQGGDELTYGELNAQANRLARHLRELGVKPEERVAICVERGAPLVVGLLAVWKAGGAYVPLDPEYPGPRLRYMLEDSAPVAVLTQGGLGGGWSEVLRELPGTLAVLDLMAAEPVWGQQSPENLGRDDSGVSPEHLAYVIYTSGSTGTPKGVMVEHRPLTVRLLGIRAELSFGVDDTLPHLASPAFDISLLELLLPLVSGGRSLMLEGYQVKDLARLVERTSSATVLHAVPSLMETWLEFLGLQAAESHYPLLRTLLVGGEAVSEKLLRKLRSHFPGAAVIELYGPTEATVISSSYRAEASELPGIPYCIGRPLPNTRIYILDDQGCPVPVGVSGEIYIGGVGVARGYLNRAQLTAQRFVRDRFMPDATARMYRSGDLGRWLPDGRIEYLGRNDFQVKVRGFRIEPGEIEARLLEHPGVREAVVLAREDIPGEKRLVGYLTLDKDMQSVRIPELQVMQIARWQSLYENTYAQSVANDPASDLTGWNSSYTRRPIPEREMREWQAAAVQRILALQPQNALEIGCGSGLLLRHIAPRCARYVGTDFSSATLQSLSAKLAAARLDHVVLLCRTAEDFSGFDDGTFDTIILNSVIQHFPTVDYLLQVIAGALRVLAPGGRIFLGDVRNLLLLEAFHTSVQSCRAPPHERAAMVRGKVRNAIEMEAELLLDPAFFFELQHRFEQIRHVRVLPKSGACLNELTCYRYDVILHLDVLQSALNVPRLDWVSGELSEVKLQTVLKDGSPDSILITNIANSRIIDAATLTRILRDDRLPAGWDMADAHGALEVRRRSAAAVDPQALVDAAAALGYTTELSWAESDSEGKYHALLRRGSAGVALVDFPLEGVRRERAAVQGPSAYANDPLRSTIRAQIGADIRSRLRNQLPGYMIPSHLVFLEGMPLTANGKLDRAALPALERFRDESGYVEPQTPIEEMLATAWAEVLKIDRVGSNDNFFELGGHSLLAMQVIARLRQSRGIELPVSSLFARPILADLADELAIAAPSRLPALTTSPRAERLPLSFAQERLWFLAQLDGASTSYNIPIKLRLTGKLDRTALRLALDRIVTRHEALRTCFVTANGEPQQRITPAECAHFLLIDELCDHETTCERERLMAEDAHVSFDLEHGPIIRGRLIRDGLQEYTLFIVVHHIVFDGWSMGVLLNELNTLYLVYHCGRMDPLPELPVQYADYALWQRGWLRGEVLERQLEYWKEQLSGAPASLELPTDRVRPAMASFKGGTVSFALPAELSQGLQEVAKHAGVTLYMVLLAAFQVLLSRWSGQNDIVVGSPIAGRTQRQLEGLIGFLVNTVVLRSDLSADPSFMVLLEQVKERTLGAYTHQDLPFEKLVEELQPVRDLSRQPIYQIVFSLQNAPRESLEQSGWWLEAVGGFGIAASFDLVLVMSQSATGLDGVFEYATDLFDRETIERWVGCFTTLLKGIVQDPQRCVGAFPLLGEAERHRLLEEWNATRSAYPQGQCIHELFEEQVQRSPDAVAVLYEAEQLTYGELNAQANRLAHYLRELGVKPEERVAICVERGPQMVVGVLAVWKAGGAYVPLDPEYPGPRLRYMLEDSAPVAVLTQGGLGGGWSEVLRELPGTLAVLDLMAAEPVWGQQSPENLGRDDSGVSPEHLAYVIYTSGSTGTPKGVMVEHHSVCNLAVAQIRDFAVEPDSRVLQFASFSFDACVSEVVMALCRGAALCVPSRADIRGAEALVRTLDQHGITHVTLPPAIVSVLPEQASLGSIRTLIVAGETLSWVLAKRWSQRCRLINAYGPTEATVCATLYECDPHESRNPPIGRPLSNVRIYILDDQGCPVPVGVSGEIYIGGVGVARGYLNRAQLTAQRFVRDRFVPDATARMYRSGDLGRWLPDGRIEYLGRNDFQVKVRGFRIEPGEIEARLLEHPGVREAVVLAREDIPGEKRLVAYYVSRPDGQSGEEVAAEGLRAHLRSRLPEYMLPAAYVRLESLPLTPNGKLDRKGLPEPGAGAYAVRGYEAPQGQLESILAGIWAELLKLERVGRHDNFFALGGHSLLAMRVISCLLQRVGVELPARILFEHPTISGLVDYINSLSHDVNGFGTGAPALLRQERPERLPLSYAQERLLFLEQMGLVGSAYTIAVSIRLEGILDLATLELSVGELIRRHESLRTRFEICADSAVQVIDGPGGIYLKRIDLSGSASEERGREVRSLLREAAGYRFDLAVGPLFRVSVLKLSEVEHVLLLTTHHIVADGWSQGVLLHELSVLYRSFSQGRPSPLPELPVQYADYALWQRGWLRGEVLERQLEYWKEQLSGAPASLELPTDRVRPAMASFKGGTVSFALPAELSQGLQEVAKHAGVTLYMVLLAAFQVLLSRWSGQNDIVVGSPIAGRTQRQLEGLIGFLVNTVVLRSDLSADPSFMVLLEQVKERTLGAYTHQDLPFEKLVEELQPVRDLSRQPIYQVNFSFQNLPQEPHEFPGLKLSSIDSEHVTAKLDLGLYMQEGISGLDGVFEYATDLFDRETIERWVGCFTTLLKGIVQDPQRCVGAFPLLGEAERHRLLEEWNATRSAYPQGQCIHELFEEQVQRSPDAVAVLYEAEQLTYGELNAQANRLAHYLRELGVKPEERVAICVERGPQMVVGVLAVWKAGGAYVPLDPEYPGPRLRYMLEDSAPVAVLTQGGLGGGWSEVLRELPGTLAVLDLMAAEPVWGQQSPENLGRDDSGVSPEHLAYVIYTSGSTGTPKGVMVEHHSVCNLAVAQIRDFAVEPDSRVLQFASFSFDACVSEVVMALCRGAALCVPSRADIRGAEALVRTLDQHGITHVTLPPAIVSVLPEQASLGSIRTLIVAGETLSWVLAKRWSQRCRLINAYGPTEATVCATLYECDPHESRNPPIGRPLSNVRIYILDDQGCPVPVGVSGEIYIGGVGVARGYLNRAQLTAQRFVRDRFVPDATARMYRSGDLGRWLPDGRIEYLGRNDFQVKVRGFRIEPGEIEARLLEHPGVREAVVLAREDIPGEKRLVAYYVSRPDGQSGEEVAAEGLRAHLRSRLPEYMLPAAYVRLESLPLTPNGKLDRKGLPEPGAGAYAVRGYEAPQGQLESILAGIWAELLKLERVGRHDNFFALGGHSLLAVRLMERMRRQGLQAEVGMVFTAPTLAGLAATAGGDLKLIEVSPNQIPPQCEAITPAMLPLVALTAEEIERIVSGVSGGVSNIQDIYPLAPLQEGILFHHLLSTEGDPYLTSILYSFDSRTRLDWYVDALQAVMDRHDILRTAVMWEGLPEPVQVVWRHAPLPVEEVVLDASLGDAAEQLRAHRDPRRYRLDVRQAPLMRAYIAHDAVHGRWLLLVLNHHLMMDHSTVDLMQWEIQAHMLGEVERLATPVPFRNFVAQARLGVSQQEHEEFFRKLLGDVAEPTAPFGLVEVQGDGSGIVEGQLLLDVELARRLREGARKLGVSAASICHLAWARVLALVSGRDDVVFGTVLFGRMEGGEGADRAMGLFINTLPVRIRIGEEGVEASVRRTHAELAELLRHEHASLALAQRCSAVPAPLPLFSALFNYRHEGEPSSASPSQTARVWDGIELLHGEERTNYPFSLSVDDLGEGFRLVAQVQAPIQAQGVCHLMCTALEGLVESLEGAPHRALRSVDVLPSWERHRLLEEWNATRSAYPQGHCIHELFEEQVQRRPQAVALVQGGDELTYGELNAQANRLARHLRELGVKPEERVAICVERGAPLVVGLLAVWKAGGAYVPLDPEYPGPRLRYMLEDSAPVAVLTQGGLGGGWSEVLRELPGTLAVLDLMAAEPVWGQQSPENLGRDDSGVSPEHLAYVIYTSGSTGTPKGVMVEHRPLTVRLLGIRAELSFGVDDTLPHLASPAFDISLLELLLPLVSGGRSLMLEGYQVKDLARLVERTSSATVLHAVPSLMETWLEFLGLQAAESHYPLLRTLLVGGEAVSEKLLRKLRSHFPGAAVIELYGPTEATVISSSYRAEASELPGIPYCIGRPLPNTRIYILDDQGCPVPVGVNGEIYIGGVGVARGYLNHPDLTAQRFVRDRFVPDATARMYRSGDLGRWLPDGRIEYLGRNDFQVKVRGFRIEPGEIEARLLEHPGVREAVVLAREDIPGEKRLVAYYVSRPDGQSGEEVAAEGLRAHLRSGLPEYMLPAAYVRLESLPLTPNGKLDRKGLPEPGAGAYAVRGYEAPQGQLESILAGIWAELLKLERVGRHDNFFALGGHSLLAVRLMERMRRQGLHAEVRALFAAPTLAEFAAATEEIEEIHL